MLENSSKLLLDSNRCNQMPRSTAAISHVLPQLFSTSNRSHFSRPTAAIFHVLPQPFLIVSFMLRASADHQRCYDAHTHSQHFSEVLKRFPRMSFRFTRLLRGSQRFTRAAEFLNGPQELSGFSQAGAQVPRGRRDSTEVLKVATASQGLGSGHQIAAIRRSRSYSVVRGSRSA